MTTHQCPQHSNHFPQLLDAIQVEYNQLLAENNSLKEACSAWARKYNDKATELSVMLAAFNDLKRKHQHIKDRYEADISALKLQQQQQHQHHNQNHHHQQLHHHQHQHQHHQQPQQEQKSNHQPQNHQQLLNQEVHQQHQHPNHQHHLQQQLQQQQQKPPQQPQQPKHQQHQHQHQHEHHHQHHQQQQHPEQHHHAKPSTAAAAVPFASRPSSTATPNANNPPTSASAPVSSAPPGPENSVSTVAAAAAAAAAVATAAAASYLPISAPTTLAHLAHAATHHENRSIIAPHPSETAKGQAAPAYTPRLPALLASSPADLPKHSHQNPVLSPSPSAIQPQLSPLPSSTAFALALQQQEHPINHPTARVQHHAASENHAMLLSPSAHRAAYPASNSRDLDTAVTPVPAANATRAAAPAARQPPPLQQPPPQQKTHSAYLGDDYTVVYGCSQNENTVKVEVNAQHLLFHQSIVCCVRYSWDGKYLATGSNHSAHIFEAESGREVAIFPRDMDPDCGTIGGGGDIDGSGSGAGDGSAVVHNATTSDIKGADSYVRATCFSPDGKWLITGAEDHIVKVWDVRARKVKHRLVGHSKDIYSLDVSADGRLVVSGSGDKKAKVWDLEDGRLLSTLVDARGPKDGITSVAVSPSSNLVATGSLDNILTVWDVETKQVTRSFSGHSDSVYSVAFSPDGRMLLSGSLDKSLKLWDLAAATSGNQCQTTFNGHKDSVLSVVFSPDGQWLVSGSKDRTVQFWDPRQPSMCAMIQGHDNSIISIAHSRTDKAVATGSGDCRARTWVYQ